MSLPQENVSDYCLERGNLLYTCDIPGTVLIHPCHVYTMFDISHNALN